MKRLIILLLVFGAVFAGSFPSTISGTSLELVDSSGTTTDGEAYYSTPDEETVAWIGAVPMEQTEWNSQKSGYSGSGWSSTEDNGMDYYYYCESGYNYDYGTDEILCLIDTYSSGTYYMIDVSIFGGTSSEAVGVAKKIGKQLGGGGISLPCTCPVSLLLIGLAGAAIKEYA